jgi:hypothetical protein
MIYITHNIRLVLLSSKLFKVKEKCEVNSKFYVINLELRIT